MNLSKIVAGVSLLVAFASSALSAPVTYDINRTIGAGSVVGTLTTDGTLGTLGSSNIVSWNLSIDDGDGSGTFVLNTGNSAYLLIGSNLTADADFLDFNFSLAGGFFLIQAPSTGSGSNWWCVESANASCTFEGQGETVNRFGTPTHQFRDALVTIGTAAQVNDVPEPGSLALLGLGLVGLAAARKRKQA